MGSKGEFAAIEKGERRKRIKSLWVVGAPAPRCWYSLLGPVKPIYCREVEEEEAVALHPALSVCSAELGQLLWSAGNPCCCEPVRSCKAHPDSEGCQGAGSSLGSASGCGSVSERQLPEEASGCHTFCVAAFHIGGKQIYLLHIATQSK